MHATKKLHQKYQPPLLPRTYTLVTFSRKKSGRIIDFGTPVVVKSCHHEGRGGVSLGASILRLAQASLIERAVVSVV